jgi:hypothetical protein
MYYGWSKEFLEAGKRRLAKNPLLLDSRATDQSLCRSLQLRPLPLENNLTLADVSTSAGPRQSWSNVSAPKRETIANHRLQHRLQAA